MNLTDFIKLVGPTESSRANNRRPEDGSRFLASLLKRVAQLNFIAAHAGFVIVIKENKAMKEKIAKQYGASPGQISIDKGVVTLLITEHSHPNFTIIGEIKDGQFVALLSPEEI